jgi:transposase
MKYIGIDQHKTFCQATVVDDKGKIIECKKIPSRQKDLQQFFRRYKGSKAVIESNTIWEFIYDTLSKIGIDVILTNPFEVKAIAHARVKTDKIDSKILAHLLRTDMIPISYVAPIDTRELRKDVKARLFISKAMTNLKNQLYAELIRKGIEYKIGFLGTTKGREEMARMLPIPRVLRTLRLLELLQQDFKEYNHELLLPTFAKDPKAKLLATIDGVGYYTALTVTSSLGDVTRFRSSDSVVCYAGLVPRIRQSANTIRMGPITKMGPFNLRWVLTEAMHSHLRFCKSKNSCRLCKFYNRIKKKHNKNIATVAAAAKLLRIMYWMLKLNQPYRPQGLNPASGAEGKPRWTEQG